MDAQSFKSTKEEYSAVQLSGGGGGGGMCCGPCGIGAAHMG